jgi:hypothetical protein
MNEVTVYSTLEEWLENATHKWYRVISDENYENTYIEKDYLIFYHTTDYMELMTRLELEGFETSKYPMMLRNAGIYSNQIFIKRKTNV